MDVAVSSHINSADFYFSPLKLYEYLACGVPTIAANIGQPAELIVHGVNGYLYEAENSADLTKTITHILQNHTAARTAAWNGARHILENHTWDQNAQKILATVEPSSHASRIILRQSQDEAYPTPLLDDKLRQRLYRATRSDIALNFFKRDLSIFAKGEIRLKHIEQIDILKYKPNRRCVLGYWVRGRSRERGKKVRMHFVGKVFRDERGRRLNHWQALLWENGFAEGAADCIHVAQPLGYLPKMRMQVQGMASGETLHWYAERGDISQQVVRSAEAIAKLHRWQPPIEAPKPKRYTRQHECNNLTTFAQQVIDERPDLADDIETMRLGLLAWGDMVAQPERNAMLHRDFYYSQLLFDGDAVTLIDFDLIALGDPAIDVANFVAHLHLMGLELAEDFDWFSAEITQFLSTYTANTPLDPTFHERLAFYHATTLFRLLHVVLTRPQYIAHFEALLTIVKGAQPLSQHLKMSF